MQNAYGYLLVITLFSLSAFLYYNTFIKSINKESVFLYSTLKKDVPMFDIRNPYTNVYFSLNKTVIEFDIVALQNVPLRFWIIYFIGDDNDVLYRRILFSKNPDELHHTYVEIISYSGNFSVKNSNAEMSSLKSGNTYSVHIEIYDSRLAHLLEGKNKIKFRLYIYPIFQDVNLVCYSEFYGVSCEETM